MTALYSINLRIMGKANNFSAANGNVYSKIGNLFHLSDKAQPFLSA